MTQRRIPVALEVGEKRVFASAIDWPGWARGGKDEAAALDALIASGPRYAAAVSRSRLGFRAPRDASELEVVERLKGDAGTDFGVPSIPPKADSATVDAADLRRLRAILEGCWRALDGAAASARGKTLRKGPRGGGRPLGKILAHVAEAEASYLGGLGWKHTPEGTSPKAIAALRAAMLEGLAASARGEIPAVGPRGGKRWSARYFVRRSAWHVLDHAWEIEDRSG